MRRRHREGVPGPPAPSLDDASLVESARRGDRSAFEVLFERHRRMLTGLVRRTGDPALVEDVVQESALAALIGLEALQNPERFGSWLAGIGLNISRRYRRELLKRPFSLDSPVGDRVADHLTLVSPDPGEVTIERQIARSVQAAIRGLPRGQRGAVALFYLSGLTYRETALALGIEVGAVKARLHKARAQLGRELSSIWKEEEEMEETREGTMVRVRASDVLRLAPAEGKRTEFVVMLEEIDGSRQLPIWIK